MSSNNNNDNNEDFLSQLHKPSSSDIQTYNALCHCGKLRYTVTLSPSLPRQKVVLCNCSICARNGYLLVYPLRSQLSITSGEETLKEYSFGKKRNLHKFCGKCGSSVFFDPRLKEFEEGEEVPDLVGVNVRMFQGFKLEELQLVHFNGKGETPFVGETDYLK